MVGRSLRARMGGRGSSLRACIGLFRMWIGAARGARRERRRAWSAAHSRGLWRATLRMIVRRPTSGSEPGCRPCHQTCRVEPPGRNLRREDWRYDRSVAPRSGDELQEQHKASPERRASAPPAQPLAPEGLAGLGLALRLPDQRGFDEAGQPGPEPPEHLRGQNKVAQRCARGQARS